MYRHFAQIIRNALGDGMLLWLVPLLVIIAALFLSNIIWRKKTQTDKNDTGIWAFLRLFVSGFFTLALSLGCLGFLAAALFVQGGLFSESHGSASQQNYHAVTTKWGKPHEQYDLSVEQFVMQTKKIEELANGSSREQFLEEREPAIGEEDEIIVSDEVVVKLTKEEAKNRPNEVVRRIIKKVRREVKQDSIPSADVDITLKSNPRQLGGATYPGYEDQWLFRYIVENKSSFSTQAVLKFPLPGGGYGIFDRLVVKVNEEDYIPRLSYREGNLEWRTVMKPSAQHNVVVGYNSRGLEYFRYRPSDMRQHCKVAVKMEGVDSKRLNFPIGAMPPMTDLKTISGDNFTLTWDLSRAVTNLDIGVMMPTEAQPGYHIAKILREAPVGLALMCLIIILTRKFLRRPIGMTAVGLTALAYYLTNILVANLNDMTTSFAFAFAVTTIPITALVFIFWLMLDTNRYSASQTAVIFGLFAIGYPLAVLAGDASGTILHTGYVVLLSYIMLLSVTTGKASKPNAE